MKKDVIEKGGVVCDYVFFFSKEPFVLTQYEKYHEF